MNISDVMSEEEIDQLPHDNHEAAFVIFARRAQSVFNAEYERLSGFQDGWDQIRREQRGFMNVIVAVAKRYDIAPLKDFLLVVAPQKADDYFNEFQNALDHYIAQIVIGQSIKRKRDGVELSPKAKDRLRGHINALKKLLDQAELTPRRRAGLMAKLEIFEKELDKHRLPWAAIGLVTLEILALPSDLVGSSELAQRLVTNIVQELQAAKVDEEERRPLPAPEDQYLLSPPRPPEVSRTRRSAAAPAFENEDDDIPF